MPPVFAVVNPTFRIGKSIQYLKTSGFICLYEKIYNIAMPCHPPLVYLHLLVAPFSYSKIL